MLLFGRWPVPPEMSESRFRRYRLELVAMYCLWAVCAATVVLYWSSAPLILKVFSIAYLCFVIPDTTSIRRILTSYEEYSKRGFDE